MTKEPSAYTRANRDKWNRISSRYQRENRTDLEGDLCWGPSMPPEAELQILGPDLKGRDILEMGCGGGQCAVYAAEKGARVVAVDLSEEQLAHARAHAKARGVEVRFIESEAVDLPMLEDRSFDVVFSSFALGFVDDIGAALGEGFRVLRSGGLLAFSWASPFWACTELGPDGALKVTRSYFDRSPILEKDEYGIGVEFYRTYGDWHRHLTAAGFVVTDILEPEPLPRQSTWKDSHLLAKVRMVPGTMIWRARKPRRGSVEDGALAP